MSEKFLNKYRAPSARMQHWDYGWNASYFITICTHNRSCYFGEIIDGEMILSELGEVVKSEWLKTFELRTDMNLHMGVFAIMPNHFHAIISIGVNQFNQRKMIDIQTECLENDDDSSRNDDAGRRDGDDAGRRDGDDAGRRDGDDAGRRDAMHCVSTTTTTTTTMQKTIMAQKSKSKTKQKFGPQSKNLSAIIRGFKSAVTKSTRTIDPNFAWQSRFHDHIIRDHESFMRIEKYIIENPAKWNDDQFFES
jgi:putative transposase